MKTFINYLKGLAVLSYHVMPVLIYFAAFCTLFAACANTGWYAACCLGCGLICLTTAVILTFLRGAQHFDSIFHKSNGKVAAADKGKKNF